MDYEEYFSLFKLKEKSVNDSQKRQHAIFNNISKDAAKGDLKSLAKDLSSMEAIVSEYEGYIREIREMTESFDLKEYMEGGDFAKQLLVCCENQSVDVKGDYPVYEIFPFKVKIDKESQDITINNRRIQCARPQYLVSDIKKNKERLMKANFNVGNFLNELANAYDTLTIQRHYENEKKNKKGKRDLDLLLKDIYGLMIPMQRFRRDYDMQSFAFDLSRLYSSDVEFTGDHRQYTLSPSRYPSQNIRILDRNGKEAFVGTVKFFSNDAVNETGIGKTEA